MMDPDPKQPEEDRLLLNALADGELDAATALSLEKRLEGDPALKAEFERIDAAKAAMQRLDRPDVSDAFRERIAALASERRLMPPEAPSRPRAAVGSEWRNLAASILLGAVVASGATYMLVAPRPVPIEVAIADSHMRSLLADSPVDIASSDRHTVKPWLDTRLGVSPPAVDLADQGFVLIGGRVDVIGGHAAPSLVYRHNEHLISLFAVPASDGGKATEPANFDAAGYHMVKWNGAGFSYWAVSDLEVAELKDFVKLYRAKS